MALDGGERRRRTAVRRLTLGSTALVAALAGAMAFAMFGPAAHHSAAQPPGTVPSTGTAAPSAQPTTAGGGSVVVLPAAARVQDGVPVGYPHTQAGAISAAAHFDQVLDWLHPTTALKQVHVMSLPSDEAAMVAGYPDAAARWQRQLGLPQDGGDNSASYAVMQPSAYHVQESAPDRVAVSMLLVTTTSRLGAEPQSGLLSLSSVMVWYQGDWKVSNQAPSEPDPQVAQPGSADALAQGWTSLALAQ